MLARETIPRGHTGVAPVALAITVIEESERNLRRTVERARGIIGILCLQAVHSVVAAGWHGLSHILKDSRRSRRGIEIKVIEVDPEHSIAVVGCGIHLIVVGKHGPKVLGKEAA